MGDDMTRSLPPGDVLPALAASSAVTGCPKPPNQPPNNLINRERRGTRHSEAGGRATHTGDGRVPDEIHLRRLVWGWDARGDLQCE